MTEDARPIPDHLTRELRALNDLELGAVIADLGVDPLKPPGAKLRGALASIAEDPHPWWEATLAGHAVDCLAKEPRRGRIAGGGAVDHARATWEGLAVLGAAARAQLPDPDAVRTRELWDAAGLTSVATWPNVVAAVAEGRAARDAVARLGRDFGVSAEPLALPGVVADAAIAFSEELKRRPWGEAQEIAESRAWRKAAGEALGVLHEHGWTGSMPGGPAELPAQARDLVRRHRDMTRQVGAICDFTGRADPVEGAKLLADEVTARGAKLAAWRGFALDWTGVAADDAAQIGAVRERLHALAEVRAVPGGAHASELAPSSCPAAEVPARMGRIWAALVKRADAAPADRLIASCEAAQAREADAIRELVRWRQWAAKLAPAEAEHDNVALREAVGARVGATWRVNDLAGEAERWARWAAGLVGDLPADEQRARLVSVAEAGRLATATAADLLELRKRLACPVGRSLLDHAAAVREALGPCVPGVPETIAHLREALAECQERSGHLARIADAAAHATGGHVKGGDRERTTATVARLAELAERAGKPPTELRDELAGVKRERDNLRREVQQNRTRSAEVSAARRQTAEVNGELADALVALGEWQAWADREAAGAGYGAAAGDPGQCRRAISGTLSTLKSAQGDLSGWRSWAILAGRLPAVELIGARGDDGKLRAAVDVMLRIASGAEDMAAELAKAQRARKSLEGRIQDAREEARIEAEARSPTLRAWREWASKLAGWPAPYGEGKDAELRAVLEGNDRRAEVTKEAIYLRDRVAELGAEVRKAGDHVAEWRGWARGHLVGASAIVNDGGLRVELSRLLEAHAATAAALRAPVGADLARMVEAIRAAAGPSTLSGPGALAEHVARLRDLAGASAADLVGAVAARDALREIEALTRG